MSIRTLFINFTLRLSDDYEFNTRGRIREKFLMRWLNRKELSQYYYVIKKRRPIEELEILCKCDKKGLCPVCKIVEYRKKFK